MPDAASAAARTEASGVLSGWPAPAPGPGDAPPGAGPLAELRQALASALAEASAGLRRAQALLDGDLAGLLAAAPCERRVAGLPPSSPLPLLPGEAPAAPPGSAPVLDICAPGASPKGSAAAALRASARAARVAEEPREARAPVEHPGGSPASRGPHGGGPAAPRRAGRFECSEGVLAHWSRMVAALEEMHSSGMSQLHSTWVDAKAYTLFFANPAHDARRIGHSTGTEGALLGANSRFRKAGTMDSSMLGSLVEDRGEEGPSQAWKAIRYMLLFVLHPFSRPRMLWDFMGMAVCLHDVAMLPALVFELSDGYLAFRLYYEWISCVFWTADIMLNFRTGFISSDGLLEIRSHKVARHYVRSWFVLDLIITIFDWFSLIISIGGSTVLRLVRVSSRTRMALRLLRMPKVNASFNQILGAMNSESLNIIAGLVKFLLILILVTHYVACVWFWLADTDGQVLTWRGRFMDSDDSEAYGYCTSMHWALTHGGRWTPASMEVVPVNVHERLYTCIVIIFAMVVFSSFVSSITQAMTLLRSYHARKVEQELLMRTYFSEFRIPRELAARCKFFLLQHERLANKRIKESDIPCMHLLPKAIREELRYEALMPLLKAHPFFDFYMELCPVGMRHICVSATDEVSMLPLEELFWHGQSVNRMFFVRIGLVSYCHRDHSTLPLEVRAGQWACEETLWSKACLVDGPFKAASAGCELITVLPAEFQSIAKLHPGPLRFCASYAEAFIKEFNSASKNAECDDLLFNNPRTIMRIVRD
ncbi:unnamed protein product, partial [Prorocentrum cordatum]